MFEGMEEYSECKDVTKDKEREFLSVIGIILDYRSPSATKGKDYMCTFRICDKSRTLLGNSVFVRMFKPLDELPNVPVREGDIAVLRDFKVLPYNGESILIANINSSWSFSTIVTQVPAKIKKNQVSSGKELQCYLNSVRSKGLTVEEHSCSLMLGEWWSTRGGAAAARGISGNDYVTIVAPKIERKHKFSLIKDMKVISFYDCAVYLTRMYRESDDRLVLYVTDYTENDKLYNQVAGDEGPSEVLEYARAGGGVIKSKVTKKQQIPLGRYVMQVTLWHAQARRAAHQIREGQYLKLLNVRMKENRDGNLEGAVSDDQKYPDKTLFAILNENAVELKDLKHRKRAYEREQGRELSKAEAEAKSRREDERKAFIQKEIDARQKINPHIKTGWTAVPSSLIGDIMTLPSRQDPPKEYMNHKYKIRCRVVDFSPDDIEDFCYVEENADDAQLSKAESHEDDEVKSADLDAVESAKIWVWHFVLKVEGQDGARMNIHVKEANAKYLLQMDPKDLHADIQAAAQLREKLFILWGDLEERMSRYTQKMNSIDEQSAKYIELLEAEGEVDDHTLEDINAKLKILEEEKRQADDGVQGFDKEDSSLNFECLIHEVGIEEDGRTERKFEMLATRIE